MRILLRILIFLLPLTAAAGRNAVDAKTAFKAYDAFNKVYLDVDRSIYRNTDREGGVISPTVNRGKKRRPILS